MENKQASRPGLKNGGIQLEELDRHIILYVKGHYKDYENITLESIFAQWCSLYVHQVETYQVMNMMLRSYNRLIKLGLFDPNIETLIGELFASNRRIKGDGQQITPEAIINYIGNLYYDLQVNDDEKNLVELGEIDESLSGKIERLYVREETE